MGYPTLRASTVNSLPYPESTRLLHGSPRRPEGLLLAETALVTAAAVLAIKAVAWGPLSHAIWLLAPAVLVVSALLPTAARKAAFPRILPADVTQCERSLAALFKTCALIFPPTLTALWLLRYGGLQPPLRPATPQSGQWFAWLFYQFMYVAVAEEIFFRGYLQRNIRRLVRAAKWGRALPGQWAPIVIAAACFAAAHVIVQGRMVSALTFLPGLVLGWLFVKTRSLLAPILFHGLANVSYCLMSMALC
ncbi:MAG: CPBP family intramembrane metalloprotease [Phycisphaerales bacterium]|nr:MAG: CPBP family intramembrane metalloprotease [Phycisphaerales bacterium]